MPNHIQVNGQILYSARGEIGNDFNNIHCSFDVRLLLVKKKDRSFYCYQILKGEPKTSKGLDFILWEIIRKKH